MDNYFNRLVLKLWIILLAIIGYGSIIMTVIQMSTGISTWSIMNFLIPIQFLISFFLIITFQYLFAKLAFLLKVNNVLQVMITGVLPPMVPTILLIVIPFTQIVSLELQSYFLVSIASSMSLLLDEELEGTILGKRIFKGLTS